MGSSVLWVWDLQNIRNVPTTKTRGYLKNASSRMGGFLSILVTEEGM